MTATVNGNSALTDALDQIKPHDHLCLIYQTHDEQLAAVVPFISIGLKRGEQCLYIADGNPPEAFLEAMRQGGIDTAHALRTGALILLSAQETYLKPGFFDPDRMMGFWAEAIENAKLKGFLALRVAAEMTWALGGAPGTDWLMEYEAKVNESFAAHDIVAMCQYNRSRFPPEVILEVIRTHPLVIADRVVCRNLHYVPPADYLQPTSPQRELERSLRGLEDYEQARRALQQARDELEVRVAERTQELVEINRQLQREVADHRLTEVALRESEVRYRSLVESAPVVLYSATARTNEFLLFEGAVEHIFGCSPGEFYADPDRGNRMIHPDDHHLVAEATRRGTDSGQPFELEFRIIRESDRQVVWLHVRIVPVIDQHGQLHRYYGVVTDVTRRKQADEALQASQEQLRQAERLASIGTLAAGIAHQINNPAGAILLSAQNALLCLPDQAAFPDLQAHLHDIVREAKRCGQIVKGVLQFAAQDHTTLRPTNLHEVVDAALSLTRQYAQARGVAVELELDHTLSATVNPTEMEQVLVNMIHNAVESGSTRIRIGAGRTTGGIEIIVEDNGCGMSPEQVGHVFDPFYTTRQMEGGTGLGMSVAHGIITRYGGSIHVHSRPGEGTAVSVELPVEQGLRPGRTGDVQNPDRR